jgi:hypothetical protein
VSNLARRRGRLSLLNLSLNRITGTARFFRALLAVRKQLATADGLMGYTLRAHALARDYWTLSVWQDEHALRAFMGTRRASRSCPRSSR